MAPHASLHERVEGWVKGRESFASEGVQRKHLATTTRACEHWVASRRWNLTCAKAADADSMASISVPPIACLHNTSQHNTTHPRAPLEEKAVPPNTPTKSIIDLCDFQYEKLTTF